MRGNQHIRAVLLTGSRSIPACAGEPYEGAVGRSNSPVYPRVCGGTSFALQHNTGTVGLSPRVRGNPTGVRYRDTMPGSIPACAGEPGRQVSLPLREGVYPRVCGGTSLTRSRWKTTCGLSPRVRGNLSDSIRDPRRRGSIPACAGEPRPFHRRQRLLEVYPRVCGGTAWNLPPWPWPWGLSPRVRGNRGGHGQPIVGLGSIPACAGEPASITRRTSRTTVYPRVCGGTTASPLPSAHWRGLSPRVRGNHSESRVCHTLLGSIPACAGEPQ